MWRSRIRAANDSFMSNNGVYQYCSTEKNYLLFHYRTCKLIFNLLSQFSNLKSHFALVFVILLKNIYTLIPARSLKSSRQAWKYNIRLWTRYYTRRENSTLKIQWWRTCAIRKCHTNYPGSYTWKHCITWILFCSSRSSRHHVNETSWKIYSSSSTEAPPSSPRYPEGVRGNSGCS